MTLLGSLDVAGSVVVDAVASLKVIAEISDKRVARKMLEHVGLSSDVRQQWPARGPPESAASFRCLDDEQRAPDDDDDPAPNVE